MKYSNLLEKCFLCNRKCGVNRLQGHIGICNATSEVYLARAALHFWEEPPISGKKGSGAVFFSNCNFKCVFCQNHIISQDHLGKSVSIKKLSDIFLNLQSQNANNINLVTPTHYIPQIKEALEIAKKNGLTIPIVYNTNGYDSIDAIKSLDGYIDIYLPDFKYYSNKYSIKYSKAPNYLENLLLVLEEMYRQVGKPTFNNEGLMTKGMIIRHLMLPGLLFDSKKIIDCIYNMFSDNVYISIMNQYTPMFNALDYPEINKTLNPKHYNSLVTYAAELGIKNGFIQDESSHSKEFVPDFNFTGI